MLIVGILDYNPPQRDFIDFQAFERNRQPRVS